MSLQKSKVEEEMQKEKIAQIKRKREAMELRAFKKPTTVDDIRSRVPTPKNPLPPNALPEWKDRTLDAKLPAVPAPDGTFYVSQGGLGQNIFTPIPNQEFDTRDPRIKETPRSYESLLDPNLKEYFQANPAVCKRLLELGLVNNEGQVISTLADFNTYRKYLGRVQNSEVLKEMNKMEDWHSSDFETAKALTRHISNTVRREMDEQRRIRMAHKREELEEEIRQRKLRALEHPSNYIQEKRSIEAKLRKVKRDALRKNVSDRLKRLRDAEKRRARHLILEWICKDEFRDKLRNVIKLEKELSRQNDLNDFIESKRTFQEMKRKYHKALLKRGEIENRCQVEKRYESYLNQQQETEVREAEKRIKNKERAERIYFLMNKYGHRWLNMTRKYGKNPLHTSTWHIRNILHAMVQYVKAESGAKNFTDYLRDILNHKPKVEIDPETKAAVNSILSSLVERSYKEFIKRATSCLVDFVVDETKKQLHANTNDICGSEMYIDPKDLEAPIIPKRNREKIVLPKPTFPCTGPCAEFGVGRPEWPCNCVQELEWLHGQLCVKLMKKLTSGMKRAIANCGDIDRLEDNARAAKGNPLVRKAVESAKGVVLKRAKNRNRNKKPCMPPSNYKKKINKISSNLATSILGPGPENEDQPKIATRTLRRPPKTRSGYTTTDSEADAIPVAPGKTGRGIRTKPGQTETDAEQETQTGPTDRGIDRKPGQTETDETTKDEGVGAGSGPSQANKGIGNEDGNQMLDQGTDPKKPATTLNKGIDGKPISATEKGQGTDGQGQNKLDQGTDPTTTKNTGNDGKPTSTTEKGVDGQPKINQGTDSAPPSAISDAGTATTGKPTTTSGTGTDGSGQPKPNDQGTEPSPFAGTENKGTAGQPTPTTDKGEGGKRNSDQDQGTDPSLTARSDTGTTGDPTPTTERGAGGQPKLDQGSDPTKTKTSDAGTDKRPTSTSEAGVDGGESKLDQGTDPKKQAKTADKGTSDKPTATSDTGVGGSPTKLDSATDPAALATADKGTDKKPISTSDTGVDSKQPTKDQETDPLKTATTSKGTEKPLPSTSESATDGSKPMTDQANDPLKTKKTDKGTDERVEPTSDASVDGSKPRVDQETDPFAGAKTTDQGTDKRREPTTDKGVDNASPNKDQGTDKRRDPTTDKGVDNASPNKDQGTDKRRDPTTDKGVDNASPNKDQGTDNRRDPTTDKGVDDASPNKDQGTDNRRDPTTDKGVDDASPNKDQGTDPTKPSKTDQDTNPNKDSLTETGTGTKPTPKTDTAVNANEGGTDEGTDPKKPAKTTDKDVGISTPTSEKDAGGDPKSNQGTDAPLLNSNANKGTDGSPGSDKGTDGKVTPSRRSTCTSTDDGSDECLETLSNTSSDECSGSDGSSEECVATDSSTVPVSDNQTEAKDLKPSRETQSDKPPKSDIPKSTSTSNILQDNQDDSVQVKPTTTNKANVVDQNEGPTDLQPKETETDDWTESKGTEPKQIPQENEETSVKPNLDNKVEQTTPTSNVDDDSQSIKPQQGVAQTDTRDKGPEGKEEGVGTEYEKPQQGVAQTDTRDKRPESKEEEVGTEHEEPQQGVAETGTRGMRPYGTDEEVETETEYNRQPPKTLGVGPDGTEETYSAETGAESGPESEPQKQRVAPTKTRRIGPDGKEETYPETGTESGPESEPQKQGVAPAETRGVGPDGTEVQSYSEMGTESEPEPQKQAVAPADTRGVGPDGKEESFTEDWTETSKTTSGTKIQDPLMPLPCDPSGRGRGRLPPCLVCPPDPWDGICVSEGDLTRVASVNVNEILKAMQSQLNKDCKEKYGLETEKSNSAPSGCGGEDCDLNFKIENEEDIASQIDALLADVAGSDPCRTKSGNILKDKISALVGSTKDTRKHDIAKQVQIMYQRSSILTGKEQIGCTDEQQKLLEDCNRLSGSGKQQCMAELNLLLSRKGGRQDLGFDVSREVSGVVNAVLADQKEKLNQELAIIGSGDESALRNALPQNNICNLINQCECTDAVAESLEIAANNVAASPAVQCSVRDKLNHIRMILDEVKSELAEVGIRPNFPGVPPPPIIQQRQRERPEETESETEAGNYMRGRELNTKQSKYQIHRPPDTQR